jgi:hypothetical protein
MYYDFRFEKDVVSEAIAAGGYQADKIPHIDGVIV